jgi:hypothetical protein
MTLSGRRHDMKEVQAQGAAGSDKRPGRGAPTEACFRWLHSQAAGGGRCRAHPWIRIHSLPPCVDDEDKAAFERLRLAVQIEQEGGGGWPGNTVD